MNPNIIPSVVRPNSLIKRVYEEYSEQGIGAVLRATNYMLQSRYSEKASFKFPLFKSEFAVRSNRQKLGVGGLIYARRDSFERELQSHFSYDSGIFIDVGANYGFWSRFVAMQRSRDWSPHNGPEIIAIEPLPENLEILNRNLRSMIDLSYATVIASAVGAANGIVHLTASNNDPGSTHISGKGAIEVPITTIDDISKDGSSRVGLIKIDVEGYELPVLRGAVDTLNKSRPKVICEVIDVYLKRADESERSLFNFMGKQGYTGRLVLREGALASEIGYVGDGNYVFVPSI